jgi:ElaB/YqjD/DUF883 family membrane-anchored ribosome-binding protein
MSVAKKKGVMAAVKNFMKVADNKTDKMRADMEKLAEKEIAKAKKEMEKAVNQVESYIRKNPEQAAVISAGIGAALGAAISVLMSGGSKKKKK